jgi:hypothetical protein
METIVKLEAPGTNDLPAALSNEPNQAVAVTREGDGPTTPEGSITVSVTGEDNTGSDNSTSEGLHEQCLSDIISSIDANEGLSTFRAETPDTYDMVKKMLAIAVEGLMMAAGMNGDAGDMDNETEGSNGGTEVVVDVAGDTGDAGDINDEGGNNMTGQGTSQAAPAQTQTENPAAAVKPAAAAAATTAQEPVKAALPEVQNMGRYAVPPRNVGNSAKPAGSDETFTASEIHNFYKDVVKGRYRGKEKEADAFEARIFQAVKEGRVTA